jgi:hypothetical protein
MTTDADIEHWLREWSRWMRWSAIDGDYPPTASGFGGAVSNFAVSDEDSRDYYETRVAPGIIEAIDAAIDSLPLSYRRAIWHRYGLCREKTQPEDCTGFQEAFSAVRVLVLKRVAIAA